MLNSTTLNTTTIDTAEARLGAAYTVEQHLRREGASLCDLLDALDDPSGFAALCDLHGAFGQPIPDTNAVEAALRDIHRVLADQSPSSLDRIGHERGLPASDITRWHGARGQRASRAVPSCRLRPGHAVPFRWRASAA